MTAIASSVNATSLPFLSLFHLRISRTRLLRVCEQYGGRDCKQAMKRQIDALFQGMAYDKDHPREMVIDPDTHRLWVFCFTRPRGQDPQGKTLTIHTLDLPAQIHIDQFIGNNEIPLVEYESLADAMEWTASMAGTRVPLLGMASFGLPFLRHGVPHKQTMTVDETYGQQVAVRLVTNWQLIPQDIQLRPPVIAQQVSRRRFMDHLRGPYPVVREQVKQLMIYLDSLEITPLFTYRTEGHTRTYGIYYQFEALLPDNTLHPVAGFLTTTLYVDEMIQ